VIACGPGGVGKTTTAAAIAAMAACHHGGRVLVVTVDPAKRLADALGLSGIGNTETRIPDSVFEAAGFTPRGELWAAMLDMKESWDALVRRHAPDAETREQILANPLYKTISGASSRARTTWPWSASTRSTRRASTTSSSSTPRRHETPSTFSTPPAHGGLLQLAAVALADRPVPLQADQLCLEAFYQVADRILGTQFLADISEFFILFQSMYDGFVARAETVTRLLSDRRTTFVVISTLEATPVREAEFFATELVRRDLNLAQSCSTRCCPPISARRRTSQWRKPWPRRAKDLVERLDVDRPLAARVLSDVPRAS